MTLGEKIKKCRVGCSLTQRELGEHLNVTYQAVSRWENDEVEPSIETIKQMAVIFGCSTDELLGLKTSFDDAKPENVEPQVIEKIIIKEETKPVLGVCERCKNAIYEKNDLNIITYEKRRSGRGYHRTEILKTTLCNSCNQKRLKEIEENKRIQEEKRLENLKKRRIHSFIWPTIILITGLIISIVLNSKGTPNALAIGIPASILGFTFLACCILFDNPVLEIWVRIATWSIKFPGVIFNLSLDGILNLIVIKITFAILGFLFSAFAVALATAFSMVVSIFVYPYALIKNLKGISD